MLIIFYLRIHRNIRKEFNQIINVIIIKKTTTKAKKKKKNAKFVSNCVTIVIHNILPWYTIPVNKTQQNKNKYIYIRYIKCYLLQQQTITTITI